MIRAMVDDDRAAMAVAMHSKLCPLIVITPDRIPSYAKTITEKRDLLERAGEEDVVLFAWVGSYSTDVFTVPLKDAREMTSLVYRQAVTQRWEGHVVR